MRLADPISLKLSKPTLRILKQQAKAQDMSLNKLLRDMIERGMPESDRNRTT